MVFQTCRMVKVKDQVAGRQATGVYAVTVTSRTAGNKLYNVYMHHPYLFKICDQIIYNFIKKIKWVFNLISDNF